MTIITDFDGTIATLDVDWPLFKLRAIEELKSSDLRISKSFSNNIATLAHSGQLEKVATQFECPLGLPILKDINYEFISYLRSLENFFVISNNLTITIEKSFQLIDLKLEKGKIFGIDRFKDPKPATSAFKELKKFFLINSEECLYIGDRDSDLKFASASGLRFKKITWGQ